MRDILQYKLFRKQAVILILAGFIFFAPLSTSALTTEIMPSETLFFTNTPKSITESGATFYVDKRADIVFYLSEISTLTFDYESKGNFLLTYSSIDDIKPQYLMNPFTQKVKVLKGSGRLTLDLRKTIDWSEVSSPIITLEGTGAFKISNISAKKVESYSEYISEKDRSFFWIPEFPRLTTIIFLTPTYWSISKNLYFNEVLGKLFIVLILFLLAAKFISKRGDLGRYAIFLSLFFVFIHVAHFTVRFLPYVNLRLYLSNEEKIEKNYYNPELGIVASTLREQIEQEGKVAIATDVGDPYAREMLCFYAAPAKCAIYIPHVSELEGIPPGRKRLNIAEIDTMVFYNSPYQLPVGFKKIYSLNKNVYIAAKR